MRFSRLIGVLILCGLASASQIGLGQRIVDFNASWCGPCQRVAPIVDALRSEGLAIERVDVSDEASKARELGYKGEPIPLVVGFDASGREVGRLSGSEQITRDAINQLYTACKQTASSRTNDPDEDITRIPTCDPWDDARFVKIRDTVPHAGPNGETGFDCTSGAVVEIGGDPSYVVSCGHGKQGKGDVVAIIFGDGKTVAAGDVIASDCRPVAGADCSIIKLRCAARKEYFHLADNEPARGDKLYLGGFPKAGDYRGRYTTCTGVDSDLMAAGGAISGESGGPVINSSGYLCGVIVATDGQSTCCCRLIHLRKLLDAYFPGRPGTIVPRADAPPPTGPPHSPLPPSDQNCCDPMRLDAIERAIDELRSSKQDKGEYATLDALNEYAKRNDLPAIPTPPDLSGLATKGDIKETHGLIDKILPAVGKVVDDKLATLPKSAAIATHVLGVPTELALPMAVVGGPAGVGLSIAALLAYRRLKHAAAGGRQSGGFHRTYYESDGAVAGRIGPDGVA